MRRVTQSRASAVLYNVLKSNRVTGTALIPANICESVPATYIRCGLEVRFCDIGRADWQADRDAAAEILRRERISVLHYHHTYGYTGSGDNAFLEAVRAEHPDLLTVDDRCLCFPDIEGKDAVSADVVLWSTGNKKCVDIGGGGFGRIREGLEYENHPLHCDPCAKQAFEEHTRLCRRDHAPVSREVLLSDWLDTGDACPDYDERVREAAGKAAEHRREINGIYRDLPGSMDPAYCGWRYQLLLENAAECAKALFDAGLFCSSHYRSLGNGYFTGDRTPNCEWLERHVINLFNDFRVTKAQAEKTAEILRDLARPARE